MSDTQGITQVIAQMRALQAQIQPAAGANNANALGGPGAAPAPGQASFADLLAQSVQKVNASQQASAQLKTAFEAGEPGIELSQVMIASEKAGLSFQAMVQVRNRLLSAYQDIMNMPV